MVTPKAELRAWQMILETMVHLMAQHVEDGVSPPGLVLQLFTPLSRSTGASASGLSLGVEGHPEVHLLLPSFRSVCVLFIYLF